MIEDAGLVALDPEALAVDGLHLGHIATPYGSLWVVADAGERIVLSGLVPRAEDLSWSALGRLVGGPVDAADVPRAPLAASLTDAVAAYLTGDFAALDALPLVASAPALRMAMWRTLRAVPGGTVVTYGELAAAAGRPGAARAAGTACATNPLAPFIPCHRVVPATGRRADGAVADVGAYGYGPQRKRDLLRFEGVRLTPDATAASGPEPHGGGLRAVGRG